MCRLYFVTNIACIAGVNWEGVGIMWQETRGRRAWNGILSLSVPIKRSVFKKKHSFISSTRKIKKKAKRTLRTNKYAGADLVFFNLYEVYVNHLMSPGPFVRVLYMNMLCRVALGTQIVEQRINSEV